MNGKTGKLIRHCLFIPAQKWLHPLCNGGIFPK